MNLTQETSRQAYNVFQTQGKREKHHEIIMEVLRFKSNLSSWGISRLCELSYPQVGRRLKEMVILDMVEISGKVTDKLGSKTTTRTAYKIKE